MDKAIKEKWIADLRSGKFKQGSFMLHRTPDATHKDERFCCLGVLCTQFDDNVNGYWKANPDHPSLAFIYKGEHHSSNLPPILTKELGLSAFEKSELTKMNDVDCLSFKEIANWIEENL